MTLAAHRRSRDSSESPLWCWLLRVTGTVADRLGFLHSTTD